MLRLLPRQLLYGLLTLALFSACRKNDKDKPEPYTPPSNGAVRPVGNASGPVTQKQIGRDGGTIGLSGILVNIPAGALDAEVTVGLQTVDNTNPGGLGSSFRLTAPGATFKKPLDITFSYEPLELLIQHAPSLGLAYQDDKGVWQYVTKPVINTANKTITVRSTHTGDWSLMLWLAVSPYFADLEVNAPQTFEALRVLPLVEQNGVLGPKMPQKGDVIPVENAQLLESNFVKKWELTGGGTLTPDGAKAVYKAPAHVQADFDQIALHLNQPNVKLVAKSRANGSMIQYRIDGGEWQIRPAALAGGFEDPTASIHTTDQGNDLVLQFTYALGERQYTDDDYFRLWDMTAGFNYRSFYVIVFEGMFSRGSINITSLDTNGYLTGNFTVIDAGKFPNAGGKNVSLHKIEGKFKVKKIE